MLAPTAGKDKPSLKETLELYCNGHWLAAYPRPVSWPLAQSFSRTWKRLGYTTLIEEAVGGWMVYILAGVK